MVASLHLIPLRNRRVRRHFTFLRIPGLLQVINIITISLPIVIFVPPTSVSRCHTHPHSHAHVHPDSHAHSRQSIHPMVRPSRPTRPIHKIHRPPTRIQIHISPIRNPPIPRTRHTVNNPQSVFKHLSSADPRARGGSGQKLVYTPQHGHVIRLECHPRGQRVRVREQLLGCSITAAGGVWRETRERWERWERA